MEYTFIRQSYSRADLPTDDENKLREFIRETNDLKDPADNGNLMFLFGHVRQTYKSQDLPLRTFRREWVGDDTITSYEGNGKTSTRRLTNDEKKAFIEVGTFLNEKENEEVIDTLIIDRRRLPIPEREYLATTSELLCSPYHPKLRPVGKALTRDECNTRDGRLRLLEWERGIPYMKWGLPIDNMDDYLFVTRGFRVQDGNSFWSGGSELDERGKLQDAARELTPLHYSGRWITPDTSIDLGMGAFDVMQLLSLSGDLSLHPDMVLAEILNEELTNADEYRAALSVTLGSKQAIDKLMEKYARCQHLIDCLFATYELYRTETYDAIKNMPLTAQRIALRNYFATFDYCHEKKGKNYQGRMLNGKGWGAMTYTRPHYVKANTIKALGVPVEVWNYAQKNFAVEPIEEPTPKKVAVAKPSTKDDEPQRAVIISKEPRKQRDGVQLDLYFGDYFGHPVTEWSGQRLSRETLAAMDITDTVRRKINNELIFAVVSNPNFDVMGYVQRVAAVQSKADLQAILKEQIVIDAMPIIKNLYGKISPDNLLKFEQTIKSLPDEPFIFYQNYTYIDKKSKNTIVVHVDANNRKQYKGKKGYKELTMVAPRFTFGGWVGERKDGKSETSCFVYVNPIYFANMVDGSGNPTNFDRLTAEYMAYNRALRNNDNITPAVEKVLYREYDRRFKAANTAARAAFAEAKQNGEKKPDKETVATLRSKKFNKSIDKQKFYDAVLYNAGEPVATMLTPKRRGRITQYIVDALNTLKKYGVLIADFSSSDDGTEWEITFIEPSK